MQTIASRLRLTFLTKSSVNPVDVSNINPKHHSKSGAFANYGMLETVRGLYD